MSDVKGSERPSWVKRLYFILNKNGVSVVQATGSSLRRERSIMDCRNDVDYQVGSRFGDWRTLRLAREFKR